MALPPVVGAVAPITVAPGRDVVQLVPRFQLWRRGPTFTFYINITTGLNKFGRWFVYIQTIYKQESLARHFKCGQKICRAEDYTSNYIFLKRGTS